MFKLDEETAAPQTCPRCHAEKDFVVKCGKEWLCFTCAIRDRRGKRIYARIKEQPLGYHDGITSFIPVSHLMRSRSRIWCRSRVRGTLIPIADNRLVCKECMRARLKSKRFEAAIIRAIQARAAPVYAVSLGRQFNVNLATVANVLKRLRARGVIRKVPPESRRKVAKRARWELVKRDGASE